MVIWRTKLCGKTGEWRGEGIGVSSGESARLAPYVRAIHFRPNNLGDSLCNVGGRYHFKLTKEEEGESWKDLVGQANEAVDVR